MTDQMPSEQNLGDFTLGRAGDQSILDPEQCRPSRGTGGRGVVDRDQSPCAMPDHQSPERDDRRQGIRRVRYPPEQLDRARSKRTGEEIQLK